MDAHVSPPQPGAASEFDQHPWLAHYDPGVPARLSYPEASLSDLLRAAARAFPAHPCLDFLGSRTTYAGLDRAVDRCAAALAALGVRPGDRIAIHLPNLPQFAVAFFGALRAGAVAVPTNPLYVERELAHQLADAGARVVVTLSKLYPRVEAVRSQAGVEHVLVAHLRSALPLHLGLVFALARERREGHRVVLPRDGRTHRFEALVEAARSAPPAVTRSPDDLAVLQYTGGTTGTAKGAMLSHRNLLANTLQVVHWLPQANAPAATVLAVLRGEPAPPARPRHEVIMAALPFFHIYGLTTTLLFGIATAATLVLVPRFDAREVAHLLARRRASLFPGVPTMYHAISEVPGVDRLGLASMIACISGAAPLPPTVQERFERLSGARMAEGYGLTEASPVTHCNPIGGERRAGSIGLPLPDTEARVVDLETGTRVLGPGEVGELEVRGPQVMQGYWRQPEETAAVLHDGWLRTGDCASMDADGYFRIVERKKDLIIRGGMNVYPREVEEVLLEHPSVREACVVGVPDPALGESIKAFVVPQPGAQVDAEALRAHCAERLARYKVPTAFEMRQELPRTLIGKYLRRALVEEELRGREQSG